MLTRKEAYLTLSFQLKTVINCLSRISEYVTTLMISFEFEIRYISVHTGIHYNPSSYYRCVSMS